MREDKCPIEFYATFVMWFKETPRGKYNVVSRLGATVIMAPPSLLETGWASQLNFGLINLHFRFLS